MIRRTFLGILAGMLTPIAPLFANRGQKPECECEIGFRRYTLNQPDGAVTEQYCVRLGESDCNIGEYKEKLLTAPVRAGYKRVFVSLCKHKEEVYVKTVDVPVTMPFGVINDFNYNDWKLVPKYKTNRLK